MRAFVAVELDEATRDAVAGFLKELRGGSFPVKWVEPENLHLTLKFLGEVPAETVPAVTQVVRECAVGIAPFRLTLAGAGAFPNLARPRVVFVGAEDERGAARELAARLDERMQAVGVPREDRPFQNHVTIGRMRDPRRVPELAKLLEEAAGKAFGAFVAGRITLMESRLRPGGPVYAPVERVGLSD